MASPTQTQGDNFPGQPGQNPDNTMNGSAIYHEDSIANSFNPKGKEKAYCVCQNKTAMNDIMANSTETYDGHETKHLDDDNERQIWESAMKEFRLGGKTQRDTAVLMISWAEDDLHTEEEVNGLEAVFKNTFNYTVIKKQISGDKPPAIQLAFYLSHFVYTYDNEATLLIVYYAGHGVPTVPGGLHWAGNRQPDKKLSHRNAAAWHDVEHIIRDAEGDALLIFDCCYAGNLTLRDIRTNRPTRSFEYIAACGSTDETNFPGPESFTSAMIWAMEDLVKGQGRFSTLELQTKIMTEAPGFPRKQSVLVMERDDSCDQRLVLAPLPSPTNGAAATSAHLLDELPHNTLDLRFWYLNRPDGVEIENLANRLKRLMKAQNIDARCISWLGLRSHAQVTLNGSARLPNSPWMSHHSASDTSRLSSSDFRANDIFATGKYNEAVEDPSFLGSFGLMRRGASGIMRRMFRGIYPRLLPVSMFLAAGLYAWYGFPHASFPFKIG